MKQFFLACSVSLLCLMSCNCSRVSNPASQATRIYTGPGPEDIAMDYSTGKARILVSCAERRGNQDFGGIFSIDPGTESVKQLDIVSDHGDFSIWPHGIDIVTIANESFLYVATHDRDQKNATRKNGKRTVHGIVKFRIGKDELHHVCTYQNDLLTAPNDLAVLPDGSFYVTNFIKGDGFWNRIRAYIFKASTGSVLYCDGNSRNENWVVSVDKLKMPNGIAVNGNKLFVTLTMGDELRKYNIMADRSVDTSTDQVSILQGIEGGDNISIDASGRLIIAASPDGWAFFRHLQNSKNYSPSVIHRVGRDFEGNGPEELFRSNGKEISGGSSGLIHDGHLYIGQVFESYVLKKKLMPSN